MHRPRLRLACTFLRLPALVLLMLAIVVNPVFAAVTDLHEASLAGAAEFPVASDHVHEGLLETELGAVGEDGTVDLLHTLMHAVHCSGHVCAIPSTAFIPQAGVQFHERPNPRFASSRPAFFPDHFRPPIAI